MRTNTVVFFLFVIRIYKNVKLLPFTILIELYNIVINSQNESYRITREKKKKDKRHDPG